MLLEKNENLSDKYHKLEGWKQAALHDREQMK